MFLILVARLALLYVHFYLLRLLFTPLREKHDLELEWTHFSSCKRVDRVAVASSLLGPLPRAQAELELDMLREQVAVHRGEFAELEASTTRKISELQLLLAGERDKVRAFLLVHVCYRLLPFCFVFFF